jgi:hypothetical protein
VSALRRLAVLSARATFNVLFFPRQPAGEEREEHKLFKALNGPHEDHAAGLAISRRLSVTKRHRTMTIGVVVADAPGDSDPRTCSSTTQISKSKQNCYQNL